MLKAFIKQTPFGVSLLLIALAIGFFALIAPLGGKKALIVRSGSMQPAIAVGDLVTVRPQTDYRAGEIVAFRDPAKANATVTHRIVGIQNKNSQIIYQTKGDANEEADFSLVPKENIIGRADYAIRGVGKLLAFAKTKEGFFATVALPALLVILFEIHSIYKEVKAARNRSVRAIYRQTLKHLYDHYGKPMGLPHPSASFRSLFIHFRGAPLLRAVFPILATLLLVGNTLSFLSDTETSTSNIFTAASSFPSPSPPVGIANHVVISEVQINGGPGQADHDFIELYNPTGSAFDLNGHRLVRRTGNSASDTTIKSWTTSTIIPAHGYYLWANNSDATFPSSISADTSTSLDLTSSHSIALRNGAENTGAIIDALSWNDGSTLGEGNEFDPDPGGDQSIERKALSTSTATTMGVGGIDEFKGNGFDNGDNATDFVLRPVSQPQYSGSATESP